MPGDSPHPDPSRSNQLLANVLDQLACPACHSDLRVVPAALLCTACGTRYPIVDGIPVLIAPPIPAHKADSE